MTHLKPLAFPLIGCYGSDGGGIGDGHCGHRMRSPVKKISRVKKKQETYWRLLHSHLVLWK